MDEKHIKKKLLDEKLIKKKLLQPGQGSGDFTDGTKASVTLV